MQWWTGRKLYPKFLPHICPHGALGTPVSPNLAGIRTVYLFNWYQAQATRGSWEEKEMRNIKIQMQDPLWLRWELITWVTEIEKQPPTHPHQLWQGPSFMLSQVSQVQGGLHEPYPSIKLWDESNLCSVVHFSHERWRRALLLLLDLGCKSTFLVWFLAMMVSHTLILCRAMGSSLMILAPQDACLPTF